MRKGMLIVFLFLISLTYGNAKSITVIVRDAYTFERCEGCSISISYKGEERHVQLDSTGQISIKCKNGSFVTPIPSPFHSNYFGMGKRCLKNTDTLVLWIYPNEEKEKELYSMHQCDHISDKEIDTTKKIELINDDIRFNEFINAFTNKFNYPEVSLDNEDQGTGYIQLVVEVDGSITCVQVVRGVSKELDAESLRTVRSINYLPPAQTSDGNFVRSRLTFPIKFRLH